MCRIVTNAVFFLTLSLSACVTDQGANLAPQSQEGEENQIKPEGEISFERKFLSHHRILLNVKPKNIPPANFYKSLAQKLIKETPKIQAKNGLLSYLLAIPPRGHPQTLPDTIELISFVSYPVYEEATHTPAGKKWANIRAGIFANAKGKNIPVLVATKSKYRNLQAQKAYDLLAAPTDWQEGYTIFYIGQRRKFSHFPDY